MRSNEAKWLACRYLPDLFDYVRDFVSLRQATLFTVGCVRQAAGAMDQPLVVRAVELLEEVADGQDRTVQHSKLFREVDEAFRTAPKKSPAHSWALVARMLAGPWGKHHPARDLPFFLECAVRGKDAPKSADEVPAWYAELFHDVFGNPYLDRKLNRRSKFPSPKWKWVGTEVHLTNWKPRVCPKHWKSSTVVALAAGIYLDRAFDRLPILADALEEAGCDNADVLTHCRTDGHHCRGCWVVDLVLGKA